MRHAPTLGFTLMELLVTVAIISILIALIMPVITLVRDSARTAVCSSNLRQMGLASMAYADDNRGANVPTKTTQYTWNAGTGRDDYVQQWSMDLLFPYLPKNAQRNESTVREVYTCPQARATLKITQWASSYGANMSVHPKFEWYAGGVPGPSRTSSGTTVRMAQIPRISETISFMDTALGNGVNTTTGEITWSNASEMRNPALQSRIADTLISGWDKNSDVGSSGPPRYRHQRNTRSPVAFVDGHVASLRFKEALIRNWGILP